MFAVISDIHGNVEALDTALADIDRRSIKKIYCLGDIVGYGQLSNGDVRAFVIEGFVEARVNRGGGGH